MKPLIFVADSHRLLREFPKAVQQQAGFALYQAQMGGKHVDAKPLKNIGTGVLEVVSDHRGDTSARSTRSSWKKPYMCCMRFRRNPSTASQHRKACWSL